MKAVYFFLIILLSYACANDHIATEGLDQGSITIVAINAPTIDRHYIAQDTVGKKNNSTSGPYSMIRNMGFLYLDDSNVEKLWKPRNNKSDTIHIQTRREHIELSYPTPFLQKPMSFIVSPGDTVVFTFIDEIPIVEIVNKPQETRAQNVDRIRLRNLFADSYSTHNLILNMMKPSSLNSSMESAHVDAFRRSVKRMEEEINLLDSMYQKGDLSALDFRYRVSNLKAIMRKNEQADVISELDNEEKTVNWGDGFFSSDEVFDLAKGDSLLAYLHFRTYLEEKTTYDLPKLEVNYFGESGKVFIDHRIRFDSIVVDQGLGDELKKFLLPKAYAGIVENFPLEDQERYLSRLKSEIGLQAANNALEDLGLSDQFSNHLTLINLDGDTIHFSSVLEEFEDEVLVNFWASWCKPCIDNIDNYKRIKNKLSAEGIEFIELAIFDRKEQWEQATGRYKLDGQHSYFAINSKNSYKLQELRVQTVPSYLLFRSNGEIKTIPTSAFRDTNTDLNSIKKFTGME